MEHCCYYRDNNLIEWDHDIDIAVWADEISQKNTKNYEKKILS